MDKILPTANMQYRSFWIGCSDDSTLDTAWPPGIRSDTVINTTLGNQMPQADLGTLAALEWAIDLHEIERIVICGHHRCKAIKAAAKGDAGEIVGHWLSPLKKIVAKHQEWLSKLPHPHWLDAVCELNTIYQAVNTSKSSAVQAAWRRQRDISLTAIVNDLSAWPFRDLNFVLTADSDVSKEFEAAIDSIKDRWIGEGTSESKKNL